MLRIYDPQQLFIYYLTPHYLAPEGVVRYCLHPVCASMCLCVCVSGQYFGI